MSRAQQGAIYNQTKGEQGTAFGDSENAYTKAQTDVGNYESQLGKYAASNPYTSGGEFQTNTNRVMANTADAGATSAGARLQGIAARTGQNPGAAVAATENMQQANTRELGGAEASAENQRIGNEAGYNEGVLRATAAPVGMETAIAGGQSANFAHALGAEEDAARTPSFGDTMGNAFAGALEKGLGTAAGNWLSPDNSGQH